MRGRLLTRALATVVSVFFGVALLSGTGQPVGAHTYPRWQELAAPPFAPQMRSLAVQAGSRVLVLGGGSDGPGDGAAYDLRTGRWQRLRPPMAVTDRDTAVYAAGVVVLRHVGSGQTRWWRYEPGRDTWSPLGRLPARLSAPSAFRSEVYALSGRRVVVYSVQLDRWTSLPADGHRPALRDRSVTASRRGTVVVGRADGRWTADRWDGLRWHRSTTTPREATPPTGGSTRLDLGGRLFVVRGDRAWLRLP
jgi:hypothetical protein